MRTFFTFRIGFLSFYVPVTPSQMLLLFVGLAVALGAFFLHEAAYEQAHPQRYHATSVPAPGPGY